MSAGSLDREIRRVVEAENCSGCGACCLLDTGLEMRTNAGGFLRPVRAGGRTRGGREQRGARRDAVKAFRTVCPGRQVTAPAVQGAARHPTMGPVISAWEAWAADPEMRYQGSSGGTLTALSAWLVEESAGTRAVVAVADEGQPNRTKTTTVADRAGAMSSAGSRYAPVATASRPEVTDPRAVVVGKPCEVAALRALDRTRGQQQAPLYLSFYCAGTPSQHATDGLLLRMGVQPGEKLQQMWYRGHGWPGQFTAVTAKQTVSTSYHESWGKHLGPTMQWRCKVCVDGVGESADITAADYWRTDDSGYPLFDEGAGVSALIARTPRGHDTILRARTAGVIVARPIDVDSLAAVQPFQVNRRRVLWARLLGARLAGRPVPAYRGFGLWRFAVTEPRETVRTLRSTWRRVRAGTTTRPYGASRG